MIGIGGVLLEDLILFLAVLIASVVASVLANAILHRALDRRVSKALSKLTARSIQYAIILIGGYFALIQVLRVEEYLAALLASLGLIGIAVAFASQQIIQNTMAGILIFLGGPIQLEDYIEVGGFPDTGVGRVKDITLTRTVLRNPDGRIVYIPNLLIITSKVINYTRSGFVQTSVQLTLPRGEDIDKVRESVMEVCRAHPRIPPEVAQEEEDQVSRIFNLPQLRRLLEKRPDMDSFVPGVFIIDVSGSSVVLEVRLWLREISDREEIVSDFLESLIGRLNKKGVQLAE